MADWKGHLTQDELAAIAAAATQVGLVTYPILDFLKGALPPYYASLMGGDQLPPQMRLKAQLGEMNKVRNLRTGEVPLALFLARMVEATGDADAATVFERALAKTNGSGPPAPSLVSAAPAGGGAFRPIEGPAFAPAAVSLDVRAEAQIGDMDETMPVSFMADGMKAARSVFKIVVHRHEGGQPEFVTDTNPRLSSGTGWVIAPGLGITNHHVVNFRNKIWEPPEPDASPDDFRLQAETARVQFDYLADPPAEGVALGPGALLAANPVLDFALLRLPQTVVDRPPLRLRKIKLGKTLEQALGTHVNILQHMNGRPMRLGFRTNWVVLGNDSELAYLTDTASGSSGSPVCDDAWAVAALHHTSRGISDQKIQILGRPIRTENVGTPIPAILAYLAANHPALHQEILNGQAA